MTHATAAHPMTTAMQRLYHACYEPGIDTADALDNIVHWDHAEEAARYLARQERLSLVEETPHG